MKKIILNITTGSDWRSKIQEIRDLNIKEVACFPTYLEKKDRLLLYQEILNSPLEKIPHVHIRHDMGDDELNFFLGKYQTKFFNIHPYQDLFADYKSYLDILYIENCPIINEYFFDNLGKTAGLCFDFSHYHDQGFFQNSADYKDFLKKIGKYKIGCCHISGFNQKKMEREKSGIKVFSKHYLDDLEELDYLREYKNYLPDLITLELENSIDEQLEIKKYLEKILEI